MKIDSRVRMLLILVGVGGLLLVQTVATLANPVADSSVYLPMIIGAGGGSITTPDDAIIVNHLNTDISQIPDYWIEQAKQYVVHYAHTSHGSQVLSGLDWLEKQNPKYNANIQASGTVVLPADSSALRFYDGNNYAGNTYITPDMYWESESGKDHTRQVVNTDWFDFSLWTWCGQMSTYSQAQVQEYLDVLDGFDQQYPETLFIYYTGHTDGSTPGSTSSHLWENNNLVRQYVTANDKILFDFADIESYDPDGNFYPMAADNCSWCSTWCSAHPGAFECQDLPACAHSHGLQCTLKAQAFWWLMARLAGWDGTPAQ